MVEIHTRHINMPAAYPEHEIYIYLQFTNRLANSTSDYTG